MRHRIVSILTVFTALLVSITSIEPQDRHPGFPVTVVDGAGRELTFERPPQRIVRGDPAV